jgi:hypothetical protein
MLFGGEDLLLHAPGTRWKSEENVTDTSFTLRQTGRHLPGIPQLRHDVETLRLC